MKILVICRPRAGVTGADIAAHAPAEMTGLARLRSDGILAGAYSPGGPGAVLIFEASRETVDSAVASLPLAVAELIDTEIVELPPLPRLDALTGRNAAWALRWCGKRHHALPPIGEPMRAVVCDRYGPPEVLRLEDAERPVPGDDEVPIKIHATPDNRSDRRMRQPHPFLARLVTGPLRPRRTVLGS